MGVRINHKIMVRFLSEIQKTLDIEKAMGYNINGLKKLLTEREINWC